MYKTVNVSNISIVYDWHSCEKKTDTFSLTLCVGHVIDLMSKGISMAT